MSSNLIIFPSVSLFVPLWSLKKTLTQENGDTNTGNADHRSLEYYLTMGSILKCKTKVTIKNLL